MNYRGIRDGKMMYPSTTTSALTQFSYDFDNLLKLELKQTIEGCGASSCSAVVDVDVAVTGTERKDSNYRPRRLSSFASAKQLRRLSGAVTFNYPDNNNSGNQLLNDTVESIFF